MDAVDYMGTKRFVPFWLIKDNPLLLKRSVTEVWQLNIERETYKTKHMAYWRAANNGQPPDVVLSPVMAAPANPLRQAK